MPLSRLDLDAAHRRYAESHDRELEAELVQHHRALAGLLANRFAHRGEPLEDLRQVALMALLRALRNYDPGRGAQFSSYAVPSILGALKRHFRDRGWLVRPPRRVQETYLSVHQAVEELQVDLGRSPTVLEIADWVGLHADEVIESLEASGGRRAVPFGATAVPGDVPTLDAVVSDGGTQATGAEDAVLVSQLIGRLPANEREVIVLSFFSGLTQGQVAARLGTSQSTVSRVRRLALQRLRAAHDEDVSAA